MTRPMTDVNAGRRVAVRGDERSYKVYTVEPDGTEKELPCNSVTIQLHKSGNATAMVYFDMPILDVEAPRASDGVRAG